MDRTCPKLLEPFLSAAIAGVNRCLMNPGTKASLTQTHESDLSSTPISTKASKRLSSAGINGTLFIAYDDSR